MEQISTWINETMGITPYYQGKIFTTFLVLLILFALRRLVLRLVLRRATDPKIRYNWRKSSQYFVYGLVIILIAPIWFSDLSSFGTFLGLLSAGLAIALKDPVSNFFGWVYILGQKPFETGDRIQIGDTSGDVVDIRFFHFSVMEIGKWVDADQSTGRLVHIPNGRVFTSALYNFNQAMGLIWNEIPILVTFESDWQKAKKILENIEKEFLRPFSKTAGENLARTYKDLPIEYKNTDPRIYTLIQDSGVLLTIRYLCPPRQRRGSEEEAMEAVLIAFSKHKDIDFAYPTTRFYATKQPTD